MPRGVWPVPPPTGWPFQHLRERHTSLEREHRDTPAEQAALRRSRGLEGCFTLNDGGAPALLQSKLSLTLEKLPGDPGGRTALRLNALLPEAEAQAIGL
jgi:hypothetical protein